MAVRGNILFLFESIYLSNTETYSGLNLNQDKATKPQTVQIVRQGEATPYRFKFNPLYCLRFCRYSLDFRIFLMPICHFHV